MNFYHRLTPALIGVSIALVQQQIAVALSASEVSKIAKEVTVLIQSQSKQPRYGSGVIIKQSANTYTVLTAAHVVNTQNKYEIVTFDGQRYPLNYSTKKQLPGVDLALVEFSSSRNYTVAKMGNSDTSTEGTTAYVAGYPEPTFAINQSIYTFTPGDITANAAKALRDRQAGAIADLDQSSRITSSNPNDYYNWGVESANQGDKRGAIAYFQKAANLFLQQGRTDDYQKMQELIRTLQQ